MVNEKTSIFDGISQNKNFKLYAKYLHDSGIKVPVLAWIGLSILVSLGAALACFFLISIINFNEIIIPIIIFIVVADMLIGMPYLKGLKRLEEIERNLPDALKQMADTLKAGSTYESALREVAVPEMGALGQEMQNVLRKLEEGENFETALSALSENVNSRLVKRVVTIIIDTVRAGAGLAEILEDISEDAREMYRVNQDRRTRTMLQVLFMVTAGAIIAPFIFGIISQIVVFLITVAASSGVATQAQIILANQAKDAISILLQVYIAFEVLASSVMMALMRDGKASKSIIYFPALLLLAFVIFFAARFAIGLMLNSLGGGI
ncbi:MAG: type II secretion system F family protein [Candidatus Diapherotrites archaeon]|nr:type II secretion system F family protein [Candidatus Diapherotrites archaeon]